ncbi:hypothetical protein SAMN05444422_10710 [Halobiforma haloterrestris]|uniref:Tat (Twin-arginine translocation) pathway signal sequence n=1 Tax=Natronobacterium haloterrestre TaxID=148448 RepID=A0A1I1I8M4_NATHA|nr:hypothetical protein [Halobiforma haloterrestris]SFC32536.1 hypothetical protein SAMN05444422_10710 [Halobiforma haloterrestris]
MTKDSSTVSRRSVLKASAATVVGGGAFATSASAQQETNLISTNLVAFDCEAGTAQIEVCRQAADSDNIRVDTVVAPSGSADPSNFNLPTGNPCQIVEVSGLQNETNTTVTFSARQPPGAATRTETEIVSIDCTPAPEPPEPEPPEPEPPEPEPPEEPVDEDLVDINVEVGDQDLESGDATTSTDINQSNTNVQQGTTISSADSGDSGADSSGGLFSFDF